MVASTEDWELRGHLQRHVGETELHTARLRGRLEAHGAAGESPLKELAGQLGALVKGVLDSSRETTTARNARDAYVSEHLEIAAYELLERVARMAGDEATADVARMNREDEKAMAEAIATSWDRVAVAGMREDGALIGGPRVERLAEDARRRLTGRRPRSAPPRPAGRGRSRRAGSRSSPRRSR
jgi:ferritin-like metal-binding protein YciE